MNVPDMLAMGDINLKDIDWKDRNVKEPEHADAILFYNTVQAIFYAIPTRYRETHPQY